MVEPITISSWFELNHDESRCKKLNLETLIDGESPQIWIKANMSYGEEVIPISNQVIPACHVWTYDTFFKIIINLG